MVGFAYPTPASSADVASPGEVTEPVAVGDPAPVGGPEPVAAPEPVVVPDPVGGAPVYSAPSGKKDKTSGDAVDALAAAAAAAPAPLAAPLPLAAGLLDKWEAWRVSPPAGVGWQKSNLGDYREGDYIPIRIIVNNTKGAADVRFPDFTVAFDYLNTQKNAIAIDGYNVAETYFATSTVLPPDKDAPGNARDLDQYFSGSPSANLSVFNISMQEPADQLVVPAGSYGIVYFQVHLAITFDWQHENPARFGAKEYPGSSAQGVVVLWDGQSQGSNTISVPVGPAAAPKGVLPGLKYQDLEGNGGYNASWPVLPNWRFDLEFLDPIFGFVTSATSGAEGTFSFTGLPAGNYKLTEVIPAELPWVNTTGLPYYFSLAKDEVKTQLKVGNYLPVPGIDVTKAVSPSTLPEPGGPFHYTVTVENTGTVALTLGLVADNQYGTLHDPLVDPPIVLAPNGTKVFEFDMDHTEAGTYPNTVGVVASDSAGRMVMDSASASVDVTDVLPEIEVTKVASPEWLDEPGGPFTYTIVVTNRSVESVTLDLLTDTLPLSGGVISDPTAPGVVLAPGESHTWTPVLSYFDAGSYLDTAYALAHDNEGHPAEDSAQATVLVKDKLPVIDIEKSVSPASLPEPGGEFTYTLTITNDSVEDVTITSLTDDYELPAEITALIGTTMTPGEVITKTYTVTHTEAGAYDNTAAITVMDNEENEASDSDDARATVTDVAPVIDIEKSVSPASLPEPGGEFTYTLTITNDSVEDVTITSLTDDYELPAEITALIGTTMTPGEVITKTYTVTHTEAGAYDNTAAITVEDNEENEASDSDDARATVTDVAPVIDIEKSVSPASLPEPGGEFTYTLTITNDSVEDVTITSLTDDYELPAEITALIGTTMTPGEVITKTYTVTHTEAGAYDNTAAITVEDNEENEASDSDDARATVTDVAPVIDIEKSVSPASLPEPGGEFTYTLTITNDSVEDVTITSLTDDYELPAEITALIGTTMTPGEVITKTYTVTHTEAGAYDNTAAITVMDNEENEASDSDDARATVTDVLPEISVVKEAVPLTLAEPGGTFTYTVTIENDSVEPVTVTTITDSNFAGPLPLTLAALIGQEIPVGGEISASYEVVHLESGVYPNVVNVTAVDNEENPASDSDSESVTVTDVLPTIDVVKDVTPSSLPEPGGEFTFTVTVKNLTVEPLTITTLTDSNFDGPLPSDLAELIGQEIPVGGQLSASYVVTHTEAGTYDNLVSVTAVDNDQNPVTDADVETVQVTDVAPVIDIEKSVSPASLPEPGGEFTYTLTITNDSVEDVTITSLTDDYELPAEITALIGTTMTPGEVITKTYTVTHTEAGAYDNTAAITVMDNEENEASDSDDARATVTDVAPVIDIEKSVSPASLPEPGGEFTYTLTITNDSVEDVTITSLTDDYELPAEITALIGTTMTPGEVITKTYTVTHTEAGAYDNTAAITVMDNEENEASDSDDARATVTDVLPEIDVSKSANVEMVLSTGGPVEYTVTVVNKSVEPVYLTDLVDDPFGDLSLEAGLPRMLAPMGEEGSSFTFTFTRTISGEEGTSHVNVVTATAYDNEENPATDSDSESVLYFKPGIMVQKSSDAPEEGVEKGTTVKYTYVVTNTGDVTLFNVTVVDDPHGDIGTIESLAPQESVTLTKSVALTETTTNVVTATGTDSRGNQVSDTDELTVEVYLPFTPPDIALTKSANVTTATAGSLVVYTLTYKNVGQGSAVDFTIVDDYDQRYVEVTEAAGAVNANGTLTWSIAGPVAPGGMGMLTYTVRVIKDMPVGTTAVKNVATAKVPDDSNDKNNTAEAIVNVTVEEEPFLPFTGGEFTLVLLIAGLAAALGIALYRIGRESV